MFLLAYLGSPGQNPKSHKMVVCVCVCVCNSYLFTVIEGLQDLLAYLLIVG